MGHRHLEIGLCCALLLSACGSPPKTPPASALASTWSAEEQGYRQALLADYQQWQHVRYRYGGADRYGIDCSAYVQRLFREQFDHALPRVSRDQARSGQSVAWRALRPGDLLFFKTGGGRDIDHVGVYVGEGTMLHVSSKRGVRMTPVTENPYWRPRFVLAKRVL